VTRWGWSDSRAAKYSSGIGWLRPLSAAVPWMTIGVLLMMIYMVSGTFTTAGGVLFDLPAPGLQEGAETQLVALVMPTPKAYSRETLVFFDDARYVLGDEASESAFANQLAERAGKTGDTTLLVLADRRVPGGELMRLAAIARRNGVERLLMAERREGGSEE